jgi:hypothetical protein
MTPILVVEYLVVVELPFEVGLVPKPNPIQIFAPIVPISGSTKVCERGVREWF